MKLSRRYWLILALLVCAATQGFASPGSPKLPSTLNFQSLNEIGVPTTEADWTFENSKLDLVIASDHLSGLRAHNTDIYLLQYMLLHTVLATDTEELNSLATFASQNGYDVESAFLHYYDDTKVTYPDGSTETIKGYGGGTAATLKDARVKHLIWSSKRYIYNLKSPLFQKFKGYYLRLRITSGYKPDGIFIDECSPAASYFPTINSGGRVVEYGNSTPTQFASDYDADQTPAFAAVNALLGSDHPTYPGGDRLLLPNVAEYVGPFMNLGTSGADGLLTEFWMQVNAPRVIESCDEAKQLADKGKILIYSQGTANPEVSAPSNYYSAVDRHQMFSLSNYWLAKQGRYTYYQQKADTGSPLLSSFWCKARDYDIGDAVDPLYSVWKTGTDSVGQSFTIYKRAYGRALILSRPKVGWTYSDFSTKSQLFPLGATYRLLHYDGTLGPEISSIGLAMGEAVTLISTGTPPPADTTAPTITSVSTSGVLADMANINWSTDEAATGSVEYGASTSYGSTASVTSLAASQSVQISGLTANTTYHYRISVMDAAGNRTVGTDNTFTTAASGGGTTVDGFIRHWAILGPFAYVNGQCLNYDYLGGESAIVPSAGDTTAGKTWTDYTSTTDQISFYSLLNPNQYAAEYLNVYVNSPVQQDCQVRIGVDDAAKVYLNGALIGTDTGYHSANADTDIYPGTLKAGWNQLLIKTVNFATGWTLYARICDTSGNPMSGLTYQLNNPAAVIGSPKIAISIAADKQTAKVGETITYTVSYSNTGNGPSTSSAIAADVDSHVTFAGASNGGTYDASTGKVRWNLGDIAAGTTGSVTYSVVVK